MKLKPQAFSSALMLLTSIGASAQECPRGSSLHLVDGVKRCVLDSGIVVIIDPEWLVAGGVALALILIVSVYTAVQVTRIVNGLQGGGGRIG
jgi:hypothetical protein